MGILITRAWIRSSRAEQAAPPVWVAGYGPIALRSAGRTADGIVLQFADPHLIEWCLGFVKQGAAEAGRDYSQIKIMSCAPVWIDEDLTKAREYVRWFPALVSNHIVDLLKKYPKDELPKELITYVKTSPNTTICTTPRWAATTGALCPTRSWIVIASSAG